MIAALALDPMQLIIWLLFIVIGMASGMLFLTLYANGKVPGFWTWIMSGVQKTPVVLNSYMDGWMSYRLAKEQVGSIVMNSGSDDEFLNRSVIDKKPMATLHGHRVMVRVTASSLPTSPDELGDIQRVLDHLDENRELYPHLRGLQEFEIFGAMGHDPQTAREIMAHNCQVATKTVDHDGNVVDRPAEEVAAETAYKVKMIFEDIALLRKNLEFTPRHSLFIDLPRVIDATQLRVASQIMKRYKAEIEALYRAKYGGAANEFWKGLAIGGGIGIILGAVASIILKGI